MGLIICIRRVSRYLKGKWNGRFGKTTFEL